MTETEDERLERLSRDRIVRHLPKRFYKSVSVTEKQGIALDGRGVKTPLKAPLILPNSALAAAVAEEWEAQGEFINPHAMPLTKLANTAIDRATAEKTNIATEILEFAGSDMVCYRAEAPQGLVIRQTKHWDPVVAWAASELDARFTTVNTLSHVRQSDAALSAVEKHVVALDPFTFTAVHNLTTLTGSALLAIMLAADGISVENAWAAANVDEDWQIETWGRDDEAMGRRAGRHAEFSCCVKFARLAANRI
jgi:chaperone required for assembly of F1-ATPase